MRGRSFLILLIAALGLGAYIYFVESKREPAGARVVDNEKMFTLEPGTIEEVTVQTAGGEVTTVRKSGDTWQIVVPATIEASTSAVSTLVAAIENLAIERVVDENPASMEPFGLETPRLTLAFKTAGDATERRLLIGDRTPTGSDLYARVDGEPRLLLIASYLEDSFDKSTFDLRDKSVLKFQRDGIESIGIDRATGGRVGLARTGTNWRLTDPLDASADFSTVDGLVSRLFQAEMRSIVSPDDTASTAELTPAQLREFGLDPPAATVTLGSGSTRAVLAIGGTHDETSRYARDLSRPLVFTIDSTIHDDLVKAPDDLRAKDVFAFRSFSAVGLDMTVDGTSATFAKAPPAAGAAAATTPAAAWKQTAPAEKDIDDATFTDLLTTLSNLRAESFAARALVEGQTVEVTARSGDAASPTVERVTFRKSGDIVHAIRDGEPGAAVVTTADFDRVLTLFRDLTSGQ
ncbi:MAG TPA: DUF4340 domain-containing protein [Vicinamibacterales bacterium]|nr:DUF4340 domain-containing protein [Vicinamibacterales bacterium]